MPARSAACSTVGDAPWESSSRAAAISASRVRAFCLVLPVSSYGIDMPMMELYCRGRSMSNAIPITRQAEEGERMCFAGGGVFTWKATAAETGGAVTPIEGVVGGGKGAARAPPPKGGQ